MTTTSKARKAKPIRTRVPTATPAREAVAAELLATIRADPADDGARQVYADLLVERDDPRGTFINMQLARAGKPPTDAQRKAEGGLLAKHIRVWLGELASVVGKPFRFSQLVGPGPTPFGVLRFERGFLAGCSFRGATPERIAALVDSPELATVEDLWLDAGCAPLFRADLPALRDLDVPLWLIPSLVGSPPGLRITTLRVRGDATWLDLDERTRTLRALPALRTFELELGDATVPRIALVAIREAMRWKHLQTIEVTTRASPAGTFTRKGSRWVGADERSTQLLKRVRA